MAGDIEEWWDQRSKNYQDECQIPADIHYGPSSPNENELNLLGDVDGRAVLELGCGYKQTSRGSRWNVRLAPKSGRKWVTRRTSAFDPKRTFGLM